MPIEDFDSLILTRGRILTYIVRHINRRNHMDIFIKQPLRLYRVLA